MPEPEPNKKMDDLLRSYAQERRDAAGGPFELPPMMRRALRDEVGKTFGRSVAASRPTPGFLSAWWMRAALGTAFAALAVMLVVQNRRQHLAPPMIGNAVLRPPASQPMAAAALRDQSGAPANTPAAGAPVVETSEGAAAPRMADGYLAYSLSRSNVNGGVAAKTRSYSQQFAQGDFGNESHGVRAPSAVAPALNSFLLKRDGNVVLVTDADGSVYSGSVIAPPGGEADVVTLDKEKSSNGADRKLRFSSGNLVEGFGGVGTVAGAVAVDGNFSFQVAGVNRRSQQKLVFNGAVVQQPAEAPAITNGQGQAQAPRVTGQAQLGLTNQFRVEAGAAP